MESRTEQQHGPCCALENPLSPAFSWALIWGIPEKPGRNREPPSYAALGGVSSLLWNSQRNQSYRIWKNTKVFYFIFLMASGCSKTTGYRVGRKNWLFFETRKSIWHCCPIDTRKRSRGCKLFYLIFSLLVFFVVSSKLLHTLPSFTTIESLLQICKNKQAISRLPASNTTSCVRADDK